MIQERVTQTAFNVPQAPRERSNLPDAHSLGTPYKFTLGRFLARDLVTVVVWHMNNATVAAARFVPGLSFLWEHICMGFTAGPNSPGIGLPETRCWHAEAFR